MSSHNAIRQDLVKALLFAALSLFLIPALTYGFIRYANPELGAFGEQWQFHAMQRAALWTLLGGVVLLLCIGTLGGLAFVNRKWQYASFVVGWRLMTVASAAQVLLQGAMGVWLSYWVTAFFVQKHYVKLVAVVGLLVLAGVALLVVKIFQRVPDDNALDGEILTEDQAPLLWRRIRHMAKRLKTAPPDNLVAGIDTSFFVTEAPLTVGQQQLTGRSLVVSIPLLRLLSVPQADAVLGHELAHFRGGDARARAQLGPKLQQYDHYVQGMHGFGFTVVVYYVMQLYRMVFQIALSRDSRAREFKADRAAAKLVSAQAIVQSLVKIAAYDHYRCGTERSLFERDQVVRGALGISETVAKGLRPYAASIDFVDDMRNAHVPHPFDSHPPLAERMRQLGHSVDPDAYGAIVMDAPRLTWADDIIQPEVIEERLWATHYHPA